MSQPGASAAALLSGVALMAGPFWSMGCLTGTYQAEPEEPGAFRGATESTRSVTFHVGGMMKTKSGAT